MKTLNGKELMRGDVVLYRTDDGQIITGAIHQFNDRAGLIRIAGFPIFVPADECILAQDAFEAFGEPLLKAKREKDAKAKEEAAKAAAGATKAPPSVPVAPLTPLEPPKTPTTDIPPSNP